MPIYEYACTSCGHKFDRLQKMDAPDPECPVCASETRKLVSASGFILKGGGWYKDHYGLKKGGSSDSSSSSSSSTPAPAAPSTPSTGGSSGSSGSST